jgi:hypothetical protein
MFDNVHAGYSTWRSLFRGRVRAVVGMGLRIDNVVHPHFVWCRFLAWHTDAATQNRESRFSAWTTGSEGEPVMCVMRAQKRFGRLGSGVERFRLAPSPIVRSNLGSDRPLACTFLHSGRAGDDHGLAPPRHPFWMSDEHQGQPWPRSPRLWKMMPRPRHVEHLNDRDPHSMWPVHNDGSTDECNHRSHYAWRIGAHTIKRELLSSGTASPQRGDRLL